MKKQLTNDKLLEDLKSSAFFRGRVSPTDPKPAVDKPAPEEKPDIASSQRPADPPESEVGSVTKEEKQARDTMTPRHHGIVIPRYHDTTTIESIRKAVKQIGKEAATHRYTVDEKKAIANIVFTYKNRGVYTSENEVSRIAINFLVEDFEQNGEESILAQCLNALND